MNRLINGLRGPEEVVKYEPHMLDEILKCSTDYKYFLENYVYINAIDLGLGVMKFKLRDYQKETLDIFNNNSRIVLKWGRRSGKTQTTLAFILWTICFTNNQYVAILANKLELAMEQLDTLKQMYLSLPIWMQPGTVSFVKKSITLSNGSKVKCAATSPDAIRGLGITLLYLDEFAFVPEHVAEAFVSAVFPTVTKGKIIISSTPNGLNKFFKIWEAAEQKKSDFVPFTIPWNVVPGRNDEWCRRMINEIGELKFRQEFLTEFIGSTSTLIDFTFLEKLVKSTKPPMIIPSIPEYCKIWKFPLSKKELEVRNWEYIACFDSGMGLRQDNSVIQICLCKNNISLEQVAKMCSNSLDIDSFCSKSLPLLKAFHFPQLIIETGTGPGVAAINYFHSALEYENLVHFDPKGRRLGLIPTSNLKEYSAIFLKTYIEKKLLTIYDQDTVRELMSFGRKGRKSWEAIGGNHDDHVMALLWLVYYVISPYFYGNVVETNVANMLNDPSIVLNKEEMNAEMIAQLKMANPEFHRKELEAGAEFGYSEEDPTNTNVEFNNSPEDGNKDDEEPPSGLMFRKK